MAWASVVASEEKEQDHLIEWWDRQCRVYGLPSFALYHVGNEGSGNAIRGARLKRMGVRAGCPDLLLDVPSGGHHGLRIEMKRRKGGRLSPQQREFLEYLESRGYAVAVCCGWDEARAVIQDYLRGAG